MAKSGSSDHNRASTGSRRSMSGANPRTATGTGRSTQRQSATGITETVGSGKQRPTQGKLSSRPRGMGLRTKFMFVLSGVTGVAMVFLGLTMAQTVNSFLFSDTQRAGIAIAKAYAQLGLAVRDELRHEDDLIDRVDKDAMGPNKGPQEKAEAQKFAAGVLQKRLEESLKWGDSSRYGDVLSVYFDNTEFSGVGVGDRENGNAQVGAPYRDLYIAKLGSSFVLPSSIKVYPATKNTAEGSVPIYRFRIRLGNDADQTVVVDIAAKSVQAVRDRLYVILMVAVLAGIGVVILVANWLAGNITRPLDLLLKDIQVVARGTLDHQTKPHSSDEIGILAQEFNRMTQSLLSAQSALVEQEKAEYELSLAREVQRQLLPAEAPSLNGYDCAAFYQGAKAVSGDYFDIIPLGNGLWGFIVADVSGKGIPGSMVMAVTRTIVRLVANKHRFQAAETLKETNRLIAKQIKRGMFVTAFYAILEEETGALTYASAGHNPMIVYRSASKTCELATTKGIAIGFNEGPIFDKTVVEARLVLQPHDAILLYTDGFPEAMNAEGEEFTEQRFYQCAAKYGSLDSRGLIGKLVGEVSAHRGQAEQSDDLTIITVRKT